MTARWQGDRPVTLASREARRAFDPNDPGHVLIALTALTDLRRLAGDAPSLNAVGDGAPDGEDDYSQETPVGLVH